MKGITAIRKIEVPDEWADAENPKEKYEELPEFIEEILIPMNRQEGDDLPVSAFRRYRRRNIPVRHSCIRKAWRSAYICLNGRLTSAYSVTSVHSYVRMLPSDLMLLDEVEKAAAPAGF